MNSIESGTYKIRPAGCHLQTIGSDLIQDIYAAVIELVKNAYDADSPDVQISFSKESEDKYSVSIEDHGHGMSRDVVIKKWLVPSTHDKLIRKTSPMGRVMQGRKGVGRFASAILGDDLLLETVTSSGEKTTAYIEWKLFADAEYLDDVEILIETSQVDESPGTKLTITGTDIFIAEWNDYQFEKLIFELKKLKSPIPKAQIDKFISSKSDSNKKASDDIDLFDISLKIVGFSEEYDTEHLEITPFPLFDLYDYQIAGFIDVSGKGHLTYSMQKVKNAGVENIDFDLHHTTDCGKLYFDIRVYDRDKDAIDMLIRRGLKDEQGHYLGKMDARRLLDISNGIGVYRNGFRIRPLGDAGFDWLTLNAQRVQEPARKIGGNQVIGCVIIESEESSGLIENSARDGLKVNVAYEALKNVTQAVIQELETRRYTYRKKAGLSRPVLKIEREFEKLFSFSDIKGRIQRKLKQKGVSDATTNEIIDLLSASEEEKNKTAEDIKRIVAIYQGQATLGKIINVVLHEGRKPLNYFRNQIPNFSHWVKSFMHSKDETILDKIAPIVKGVEENTSFLAQLFAKLDPLAAGRRSSKMNITLFEEIQKCSSVFDSALKNANINLVLTGNRDFQFYGWIQDVYSIFTNLIENSIYWIEQSHKEKREIRINIVVTNGVLQQIDYFDSGTGINADLIASKVIFEPDFSTKPSGTGLGLAIAGEAAERNNLLLSALDDKDGACFRLEPILNEKGEQA